MAKTKRIAELANTTGIDRTEEIEITSPEPEPMVQATVVAPTSAPPMASDLGIPDLATHQLLVISVATIEAPVVEVVGDVYCTDRVDVHLDRPQRLALKRLVEGLRKKNYELKNGHRVERGPDAIRWLLEQITP